MSDRDDPGPKTASASPAGTADTQAAPPPARGRYHHGALREALLVAAEAILDESGLEALTLRGAARRAGVSHAAPAHHFGDLRGLLTELATIGFRRLAQSMQRAVSEEPSTPQDDELIRAGRAYVQFAQAHHGLFQLMFRSNDLDYSSGDLHEAASLTFEMLGACQRRNLRRAARAEGRDVSQADSGLPYAVALAEAWSVVHGFAFLAIDGRLAPILRRAGTDENGLLSEMLRSRALRSKAPDSGQTAKSKAS